MDEQASMGTPPASNAGQTFNFNTSSSSGTPPPVPPVITSSPAAPPPPPRRGGNGTGWKIVAIVALILLAFTFLGGFASRMVRSMNRGGSQTYEREQKLEEVMLEPGPGNSKIAVIDVEGVIMSADGRGGMSMPELIREELKAARRDRDVKAVILKINSPGGEVLAADEINAAIREFQDKTKKPVIASMQTLAASGGYYVAAPCRWIVANELTITGSIGVIMHGYNYRGLMNKIGIKPDVYKSGKFKDMLSGDREPDLSKLTDEEREVRTEEKRLVQDLIDETFNRFKEVVKTGRDNAEKRNGGKGKSLSEKWADYADGRVFSGKQALELGFVDETGNFDAAVKRAKLIADIDNASLIEYRQPFNLGSFFRLLGKTETPAMKVDIGISMPKLQAGQLYYMYPGFLR